ncbi:Choline-sulfatase [compost metagenome]
MWNNRFWLNIALLFAVSLLLVPKIILIAFFSDRWIDTSVSSIFLYVLQDLTLIAALYLIAINTITRNKYNFYLLSILSGALLLFLLLDMRVRELWLKPLDGSLISYSLQNSSNLVSGLEIFLNQQAGFGFTFRFIVFVVFLAYLASWLMVGLATYRIYKSPSVATAKKRAHLVPLGLTIGALLMAALYTQDARYDLNKNIFVNPLVTTFGRSTSNTAYDKNLQAFEQPAYPLSAINHVKKLQPQASAPFRNLVFIVLESVRWNSIFGQGIDTAEQYPTFAKLSQEGMLFKSYVTVPHSSKGYYSIFTGLHAYPDVEIKEAMHLYQPGIIHELKKKKDMQAVAFSSLFLQFENMDGFLKSIGVSNAYAVSDLMTDKAQAQNNSSFGESDEHLFSGSIPYLKDIAQADKGFIALYFPSAAHYPYDCSNGSSAQPALKKYEACIKKTDTLIGEMLGDFNTSGLLDSTLFVLVGDHGESFGEHGLFIHNSSMYEEEVTVPLIFWANGKVLPKHAPTISQQTDIAPTLADLFGVTDATFPVQGVSLLREQGKRVFYMSTFFDQLASAIVDQPYKYIYEYSPNTVTKFNLEEDPQEKNPLAVEGDEFTALRNRLLSYNVYQKELFAKQPEQPDASAEIASTERESAR